MNTRGGFEQTVIERVEDGDKEKRRKRRPRRPKQNSSTPVKEPSGIGSGLENGRSSSHGSTCLRPHKSNVHPSDDHECTNASSAAFQSLPIMHINEQVNPDDAQKSQIYTHPSDPGGNILKSCLDSTVYGGSSRLFMNKDFPRSGIDDHTTKNVFSPHWSMKDVNDALERGDAFKALFHVNAHNRLEAYCKVEGVTTDILIGGIAAQNRAFDGDIVAIQVEPLSLWTRMKGFIRTSNNSAPAENDLPPDGIEIVSNNCKGKDKGVDDQAYANHNSCMLPMKEFYSEEDTFLLEPLQLDPTGRASSDVGYGYQPSASYALYIGSSGSGVNDAKNAVDRLCAMIGSYPSKRPTGRVVAVIERSRHRDAIVGYLNVQQWFYYKQLNRKDTKKKQNTLSFTEDEHIHLTPTDPKFPRMMVFVRSLPDCLKKRLENGDGTLDMELVAARIDEWAEDSLVPGACILHAFGRGGEVDTQLNAILFANSISVSEFSPESLVCLPHLPWEVPPRELQSRFDCRNLCIFTIDPSTATDLDDALSIEEVSDGIFRVGVHIADVSYFVLPNTELDKEAQIRSASVYMLKKKLPILPPLISENIGSLNPGVDRLAFSMFLDINLTGDVVDRWIGRTVIQSCCKLSYEQAQGIIDGSVNMESSSVLENDWPQLHGPFEWLDLVKSVKNLHDVSKILKEKRFKDGALQLECSELVILLDEHGDPYNSMVCELNDSNFLVEEFMLLANLTAAEVISRAYPESALLRRHPEPNMRKLREFEAFCFKHGLELDTTSSGQLNQSLQRIREKLKDDSVLFDILIIYATKPMQLATYFCSGELKENENDWGHYALAIPVYTHFTSPLRRYPDIVVHRTLAAVVEAEESYYQRKLNKFHGGEEAARKCFIGINFDRDAAGSYEGREALSNAALKHGVPGTELLADVAAHCNERKLASRHVKDACDKLYMWSLLKKREIQLSDARVLGVGPRFMSIYIQKLSIERRIYYDEVEGLTVEWLEATSTLVLHFCPNRHTFIRSGSPGKWRALVDVALIVSPYDLKPENDVFGSSCNDQDPNSNSLDIEIDPAVFPLTVRLLSTIPVALHAVGGDDGPIDIGVRLYASSYFS